MSISKITRGTTAIGLALLLAVVATPAIAKVSYAKSKTVKLFVTALGSGVTGGAGSSTGSSTGTFVIDTAKGSICYNIKVKGLPGVQLVHIHKGALGADGPVAVGLNAKKFNAKDNTCITADKAALSDIAKYPSNYYFNVHTAAYPNGAVRGQLSTSNRQNAAHAVTPTKTPKPTMSATSTPTPSSTKTKTSNY